LEESNKELFHHFGHNPGAVQEKYTNLDQPPAGYGIPDNTKQATSEPDMVEMLNNIYYQTHTHLSENFPKNTSRKIRIIAKIANLFSALFSVLGSFNSYLKIISK
jgi:hypothetical protein